MSASAALGCFFRSFSGIQIVVTPAAALAAMNAAQLETMPRMAGLLSTAPSSSASVVEWMSAIWRAGSRQLSS